MISILYLRYRYRLGNRGQWKVVKLLLELRGWSLTKILEVDSTFAELMDKALIREGKSVTAKMTMWIGNAKGRNAFSRKEMEKAAAYVLRTL